MTVEEIVKTMNEKADAMLRERERIINFIEILEDGYRGNGFLERAAACRGIIEQLRVTQ